MGAVLRGRDNDLGRELAVKVLLDIHRGNPTVRQRFMNEAQIAGQLQHPGIVPIYECGHLEDDRPFFSMKLIVGHSLRELLESRNDVNADLPRLIGIFLHVCQAMAYAHSRGVIHRDLKPENIMVGQFGEVQVTDWGLAKVLPTAGQNAVELRENSESTAFQEEPFRIDPLQTHVGSVMGTPAYMSPEQARGTSDQLDERADVFALGATLCEILTGHPPCGSGTISASIAKTADFTQCFQRLNAASIDRELVDIVRRSTDPSREHRYRDARQLTASVEQYQLGVRRRMEEAQRAEAEAVAIAREESRRRKLSVLLIVLLAITLAITAASATYFRHQQKVQRSLTAAMDRQRQRAESETERAINSEAAMKRILYVADMNAVQQAYQSGDAQRMQTLLRRHRPAPGDVDLRGFEWRYWSAHSHPSELSIHADAMGVNCVMFDSMEGQILSAGNEGVIRAWDNSTGELIRNFEAAEESIVAADLSCDGRHIVGGLSNGTIIIWGCADGRIRQRLQGDQRPIFHVACSEVDPELFASCVEERTLQLWRLGEKAATRLLEHEHAVHHVAFSPTGDTIASLTSHSVSGGLLGELRLYDLETGETVKRRQHLLNTLTDVAFAPDGRWLAICGNRGFTSVMDAASLDVHLHSIAEVGSEDATKRLAIAFLPDGTLATAGVDRIIRVHVPKTYELSHEIHGHSHSINDLAVAQDHQLWSASDDGSIKRWNVLPVDDVILTGASQDVAFDEAGRRMLISDGSQLQLMDTDSRETLWATEPGPLRNWHNEFVYRDKAIITCHKLHFRVHFLEPATGKVLSVYEHDRRITDLAASRTTPFLALACDDGSVTMLKLAPDGESATSVWSSIVHSGKCTCVTFSPEGQMLATSGIDGVLQLIDATRGDTVRSIDCQQGSVHCVAFDANGQTIATGGADRTIQLREVDTLSTFQILRGHANTVVAIAFAGDGRTLASGSLDSSVRLWNRLTGESVTTFAKLGGPDTVNRVVFSSDGRILAAACGDADGRIWIAD
ncbi:MAG: protein kinase [Pirellulaceae bacterium]